MITKINSFFSATPSRGWCRRPRGRERERERSTQRCKAPLSGSTGRASGRLGTNTPAALVGAGTLGRMDARAHVAVLALAPLGRPQSLCQPKATMQMSLRLAWSARCSNPPIGPRTQPRRGGARPWGACPQLGPTLVAVQCLSLIFSDYILLFSTIVNYLVLLFILV